MLLPDYQPGCVFHSVLYFILYFLKVKNRASLLPVCQKKHCFRSFPMLYSGKERCSWLPGGTAAGGRKDRISQKGEGSVYGKNFLEAGRTQRAGGGERLHLRGRISPGRLFQRIVWNPPCFEDGRNGMREGGESGFLITAGGKTKKDVELSWTVLERDYPRYRAKAQVLSELSVEVCAFAPLAPGDTEPMFLPSLLVSLSFEGRLLRRLPSPGPGKPTREMLEGSYSAPVCLQKEAGCFRAERGDAFLELSGGEMGGLGPCGRSGLFSVETSFRMQGKRRVQAMLGYFPKGTVFASTLRAPGRSAAGCGRSSRIWRSRWRVDPLPSPGGG